MATESATRKREQVILPIEDKTGVIDMLDHGSSSTALTAKCGIAKSIVSDIKKNKAKILTVKREMADMGMSLKAKTRRLGDNYHYNYIIILGETLILQCFSYPSELFTYPNTPLPKGGRISEDALYLAIIFLMADVHREVEESGLKPNCKEVVAKTDTSGENQSLNNLTKRY